MQRYVKDDHTASDPCPIGKGKSTQVGHSSVDGCKQQGRKDIFAGKKKQSIAVQIDLPAILCKKRGVKKNPLQV
jgi:hypothetical protein